MPPSCAPQPLADDDKGRDVAGYIASITERAGLRASFAWKDGRVIFS
jgi:hypothetical protein